MSEAYDMAEVADPERSTLERYLSDDQFLKRFGTGIAVGFLLVIGSLISWIMATQVDYPFLVRILDPMFIDAFFTVIRVVVISSVFSVILGIFIGLGRISSSSLTKRIATGYVEFFRGTPLLFQIFVIYFGIPALWETGTFPIPNWNVPAAIIALTLNHGAYVGEAVRGGIGAVPDGQMEAARSLGMSRALAMRKVVLPQAWKNALAAIGNDQIILVKDTSLLTVIAVPEILSAFRNINSTYLDPWTPLVWVCILYLMMTMSLSQIVKRLEARAEWGAERV